MKCPFCGQDNLELEYTYNKIEQRKVYEIFCPGCSWVFTPQSVWTEEEIIEKFKQRSADMRCSHYGKFNVLCQECATMDQPKCAKGREITFKAKCCDARYGFESYYLKDITGTGFKVVAGDAFVYAHHEWLEVEIESLEIIDSYPNA